MLINIISFYLIFVLLGFILNRLVGFSGLNSYKNLLAIFKINLNFISSFCLFILITHLISFLTQSFVNSMIFSFTFLLIATITLLILKREHFDLNNDFKLSKPFLNLLFLFVALVLAYNFFLKDYAYDGSWDRILHAYSASLLENNFYPPKHPNSIDMSTQAYHYGTSVFTSLIQWVSQTEIVMSMSLVIGFTAFVSFLALASFISIYISNSIFVLVLTFFALYFSSFNALEFMFFHSKKISVPTDFQQYLNLLSGVSAMSVKTMGKRMAYYGWAIGYSFLFSLITVIAIYFKENKKPYLHIFLVSFFLYFTYSPFWYPLLGGVLLFLFFEFLLTRKDLKYLLTNSFYLILTFGISRFLTFTSSMTKEQGLNLMIFKPSSACSMWDVGYWNLFEPSTVLQSFSKKYHYYGDRFYLEIPLSSSIAMREFLLVAIIATLVFVFLLYKKELHDFIVLYFSGILALSLPYLFEYTIRPIEIERFLVVGKGFLLIFLVCFFSRFLKIVNWKSIAFIVCLALLALPEMNALCVFTRPKPSVASMPRFSSEVQQFIKEVRKIHNPGDIALEDSFFDGAPQESSNAGFLSGEGEYMKLPAATRVTALQTLNPFLLKEMKVDYLFVSKNTQYVNLNSPRLMDANLFEKVDLPNTNWFAYKFNQNFNEESYKEIRNEYIWVLAYENMKKFTPIKIKNQVVASFDKKQLVAAKEKLRDQIVSSFGKEFFIWTQPRALVNPAFKAN